MASFVIEGGHQLHGSITAQGAKNEALEVICACLLTDEAVLIRNIPEILDVQNLIKLLEKTGVSIRKVEDGTYEFRADNVDLGYIGTDEFIQQCAKLRGSILMLGPLLGRFHKAYAAKPGGDQIGRRRLDTHFIGISKLGATFSR